MEVGPPPHQLQVVILCTLIPCEVPCDILGKYACTEDFHAHAHTDVYTLPRNFEMTSCEPGRSFSYSEDLRWRIIWQKEVMGYTLKDIANNLNIDISTVWRLIKLFETTGNVSKRPYPKGRRFKKLTDTVKLLVLQLILEKPGMYLREVQKEVYTVTGVDVSATSLCNFLKCSGFSCQKMRIVAKQRDDELRSEFITDVSIYERHMLVFVDETGTDRRDSLRRYGYSLHGKTPRSCKVLVRGERISVIGIMTSTGIPDLHVVRGGVDGDEFLNFLEKHLLPCLMPFNGTNENSVVIMDNCSIHHVAHVTQMITEVGAIVHYLPPYSPDFNPIEWCFSKV